MSVAHAALPFAALVGQERLKKALILNAINPRLGGVLIRGEKGTAKSSAARGLAELLPPIRVVADCPFNCDPEDLDLMCPECRRRREQGETLSSRLIPMPVVDLPLGTTEDRLLGTIDLEKAIKKGEKHFEPGIMAAAHRGILYVDEVNLLDDHLVDVLLDAAAMGVNVVQREGISFTHPARFILVGTMNPEEGELRPQLLDRFGLCVEVTGLPDPGDRVAVVERYLEYEQDPAGFARRWAGEQERLRQAILAARARLPKVSHSRDILLLISNICLDQGVDGHRADIYMLKVAKAIAAYHDREWVTEDDVREAAELVLLHRLRRKPFSDAKPDQEKIDESIRKHQQEQQQRQHQDQEHQPPPEGPPPQDPETGQRETHFAPDSPFPLRRLDLTLDRQPKKSPGRRTQARTDEPRGHYVRATIAKEGIPDVAIDATLRAAAPYQSVRDKGNLAVAVTDADLRHKVRERRIGHNILFVVDASGSMGANQRMIETKTAIISLLLDAYQKRERVGLVVFRGEQARVVLPFTNSVDLAQKHLEELPTGGKTPLPHALGLAYELIHQEKLKNPGDAFLIVLISDGKANIGLGHRDIRTEIQEMAARLRSLEINSLILDTESGALNLGCMPAVAEVLGGKYYRLGDLRAPEMVAKIGEILAQ
ncbi:MAG: putative cobaltochelatase [Desulfobaccales bacterium]